MSLTDHMTRLLAGVAFGTAALVLSPATADAGDGPGDLTIDPCLQLGTCPDDDDRCDPDTEICDFCDPSQAPCTPDCDPDEEDCAPECDPHVDECGDPDPDPDPNPGREPIDPPVVARPTFTG